MSVNYLEIRHLQAFYGDAQALFDVNMTISAGEIVAIIGANGAGKTTVLRCITGLLRISSESIFWRGQSLNIVSAEQRVRQGIAMVPEGRRLFPSLTVEENLLMGCSARRQGLWNLSRVYELFPVLQERRRGSATMLSGGQQQMVAIGRALMSNPDLLLCDELSLGLAPIVVHQIYASIPSIVADGTAVVIVEQDVAIAQRASNKLYCLRGGRVVLEGPSNSFTREQIDSSYF